jgi:hypothetical protein
LVPEPWVSPTALIPPGGNEYVHSTATQTQLAGDYEPA